MDEMLGERGELLFSQLCVDAGLFYNRSIDNDKAGWDHVVEFPQSSVGNVPGDLEPAPIECKFQIKATQRRDRGVNIKLSNMKRFIDYSYPAFIFFVEYTKDQPPAIESCYLVHVGKALIRKTLFKLRENDSLDCAIPHNRIKLWVGYNESNKLKAINGASLLDCINAYLPNGVSDYVAEKEELKQSIGYEKRGWIMRYEHSPEALREHMLNSAKGIDSPLKVRNPKLFDNRFNIPGGEHLLKSAPTAQVSVNLRRISTALIRFYNEGDVKYSQTFEADVVPVPFPDNDSVTVVLRAEIFSFELNITEGAIANSLCFAGDKVIPLQNLFEFVELWSVFEMMHDKGLPLNGEIIYSDTKYNMKFFSNYTPSSSDSICFDLLYKSLSVIKNEGLLFNSDAISWYEMTGQYIEITLMACLLCPDLGTPLYTADDINQLDSTSDGNIEFPINIKLQFSSFTIDVSATIIGSLNESNRIAGEGARNVKKSRELKKTEGN